MISAIYSSFSLLIQFFFVLLQMSSLVSLRIGADEWERSDSYPVKGRDDD